MSQMPRAFRPTSSIWPAGLRLPAIIRSPPRWPLRPTQRCAGWVEEVTGQGVHGFVDGLEVRLGRPSFCGADELADDILCRDPEASVVAFHHGETRHVFAVRQRLRPDAARAVAALQQCGIGVEILSGDREPAVRHAAQSLGIQEWRSGVTPSDKIARIEELKRHSFRVLMVGDGMNDAPGLAAAHVSMSPVTATHLSQATADLVFLGDRLTPVVDAISFSRKALRLMRQNLWLAAGYNLLAVPLAVAGLLRRLWLRLPYRVRPFW